jgi:glycosyltransferase involved in cell wall biosynthesis
MFSICSVMYNVIKMDFAWQESIQNWVNFLDENGEIVIVVNKSEDDSLGAITREADKIKINSLVKFKIIPAEISYEDALFDGILKNIAYKNASMDFVIALDADERLLISSKKYWVQAAFDLSQKQEDALFVPVVNLFKNEDCYSDIAFKFYLVKNKPYIHRGVVNYAKKENGKIDITKSDSTEWLLENDNLIRASYILNPALPDFLKIRSLDSNPFVYHLGYKDLEYRKKINFFWKPVWESRAGHEVNDIKLTDEDFSKVPYFQHNLPHWNSK